MYNVQKVEVEDWDIAYSLDRIHFFSLCVKFMYMYVVVTFDLFFKI